MQKFDTKTFQGLILTLQDYWARQGCTIVQPLDMEVGAGTSHPMTCLRALGPEPMAAAYVQPSRRPTDGRYGENPNRLQHYYQFQVVIKPSPDNIQELYLGSLKELGLDPTIHDIRFVEDNWENPTLGAWGLGWEVWLNGMEVTQFTYFQQVGGLECKPVTGEITYGLERLAMYIQGVDSVYDLVWSNGPLGVTTYGDVFHQNEVEQSTYNFEYADVDFLFSLLRAVRERSPIAAGAGKTAAAAGLRTHPEGGPYLQPAGRAQGDFGDRASTLHSAHPHADQSRCRSLLRFPRGAGLPDVQQEERELRGSHDSTDFPGGNRHGRAAAEGASFPWRNLSPPTSPPSWTTPAWNTVT